MSENGIIITYFENVNIFHAMKLLNQKTDSCSQMKKY